LRKEKKKELEQMQNITHDSEEQADLDRVTERATLKHSKSSKSLHFMSKHADNTVKNLVLGAKDKKRKELLQKGKPNSEDSSAEDNSEHEQSDNEYTSLNVGQNSDNPWTNNEDQLLHLIKDNHEIKKKEQEAQKNVDPNAFLQINMKGQDLSAGNINMEDANLSEDEDILSGARNKIYEAFAEDEDILRDFKKEAREKQEAKNKKKQHNQTLPGWGSWVGNTANGKLKAKNDRAKNMNRILERQHGPKEAKNSKVQKGYQVIMNESAKGKTVRDHQPTTMPFPFTGVSDFEASIRTPIGDTFIPRTSFKKLVHPKINVAKGAIIEPVDKTELVNRGIAFGDDDKDDYDVNVV
jgi:U3 small nucleolar RNA-associated protein 14